MKDLKLYNIDNEYINYLQQYELNKRGFTKVSHNTSKEYKNKKAYVGIVFKIYEYSYFVPLTHPKIHYDNNHKFFNRILSKIKLKNGRDYGRLMYCYMVPIKDKYIDKPININEIGDDKYKSMLTTQYFYINSYGKRDEIIKKAKALYLKVHNNPDHYLHKYCCDFQILKKSL